MLYSIKIGKKEFIVKPLSTSAEMRKGLSGAPRLGEDKGLFFLLQSPGEVTMNMGGMKHPIDMIFIGKDLEVKKVSTRVLGSKDITVQDIAYVLEVRANSGKGLEGEKVNFGRHADKFIAEEDGAPENIIISAESYRGGGVITFKEDKVTAKSGQMQVLDHDGKVLMNIKGGERIFSIEHTNSLVTLSKKVEEGKADPKELGKLMGEILHTQNTQKPEYV